MIQRPIIGLLLLLSVSLSMPVLSAQNQAAEPTGSVTIRAPSVLSAGSPFEVIVTTDQSVNGETASLVIIGGYGSAVRFAQVQNGEALFTIDEAGSQVAGVVTLSATIGAEHANQQMTIMPGEVVEPVKPLIGERSIVADGDHWSMVVVIPFDQFGNPVSEGTPVEIRTVHPGNVADNFSVVVTNLLAWRRVYSGTVAGRTTVAVRSVDATGPEGQIEEVAGWPIEFTIAASSSDLPANGRDQLELMTDVMIDRFGNVLPDGTLVTFVATSPSGETRIPAVTVGGVATALLRAPAAPSTFEVHALVFDIKSTPITVRFGQGPAAGVFPLSATLEPGTGDLIIDAGTMTTATGGFVPDGTVVTITLINEAATLTIQEKTVDGHAHTSIRRTELVAGDYRVEAVSGSGTGSTRITIPEFTTSDGEAKAPA